MRPISPDSGKNVGVADKRGGRLAASEAGTALAVTEEVLR